MASDKWRVFPGGYPHTPGVTPASKLWQRPAREVASGKPKRVPLAPPPPEQPVADAPVNDAAAAAESEARAAGT